MRLKSDIRCRAAGQAVVEMALVMPLLGLIVAGVIHFGSMVHAQQVITNAARVGARLASQPGSAAGAAQTAVMDYCETAGLDMDNVSATIIVGSANTDGVVTVRYQFSSPLREMFIAMASLITGENRSPTTQLEAECTMRFG